MLAYARKLWIFPGVEPRIARYNMRAWIRQVRILGDRWSYSKTWKPEELKAELEERKKPWTAK